MLFSLIDTNGYIVIPPDSPQSGAMLQLSSQVSPWSYEIAIRISQAPRSPNGQSAQTTATVPASLLFTTGYPSGQFPFLGPSCFGTSQVPSEGPGPVPRPYSLLIRIWTVPEPVSASSWAT